MIAGDRSTGKPQPLTLRGFRPTAYGNNQMNSIALCGDGKEESILALTILEVDNAAVPVGVYIGSFVIEAPGQARVDPRGSAAPPAGGRDEALVEALMFDYTISIEAEPASTKAGSDEQGPPEARTNH